LIDVENPMTILTQDTARQFISKSSAKEKYQFFMSGTQLQRVSTLIHDLESRISVVSDSLAKKKSILPELADHVRELEAKWKEMEAARTLELEINHLESEKVWIQVQELENVRLILIFRNVKIFFVMYEKLKIKLAIMLGKQPSFKSRRLTLTRKYPRSRTERWMQKLPWIQLN
jgi:hypothetical protein